MKSSTATAPLNNHTHTHTPELHVRNTLKRQHNFKVEHPAVFQVNHHLITVHTTKCISV